MDENVIYYIGNIKSMLTLCIVQAWASTNGIWWRIISTPFEPLPRNLFSDGSIGIALSGSFSDAFNAASSRRLSSISAACLQPGFLCIGSSNMTNTIHMRFLNLVMNLTIPKAPLARPSLQGDKYNYASWTLCMGMTVWFENRWGWGNQNNFESKIMFD